MGEPFHIKYYKNTKICHITSWNYPLSRTKSFRLKFLRSCFSLLATWFLERETQRGKKWTPAMTLPQIRQGIALIVREAFQCGTMSHMLEERQKRLRRN